MKRYSYPYLITATLLLLTAAFMLVWWLGTIYWVTFLRDATLGYTTLSSMAVAFFLSLAMVRKGVVKNGTLSAYLKLYAGMCILTASVLFMGVITVAYFLPGVRSAYSATYVYHYGSTRSCSGAEVRDPDLRRDIRICHPLGDAESNRAIYVEKRTSHVGTVITYAATYSDDASTLLYCSRGYPLQDSLSAPTCR